MHETNQAPAREWSLSMRDPLEHFRGHAPGWKLAALVVCKLPLILPAMAGLVTAVAGLFWSFQ